MERESFESEAIAKLMNDSFVNIKVDKEERSDVDRVYMTYVQVHDFLHPFNLPQHTAHMRCRDAHGDSHAGGDRCAGDIWRRRLANECFPDAGSAALPGRHLLPSPGCIWAARCALHPTLLVLQSSETAAATDLLPT